MGSGAGVRGEGFGLGFRISFFLGLRSLGLRFRASGFGFRFRFLDLGLRVFGLQGSNFRDSGVTFMCASAAAATSEAGGCACAQQVSYIPVQNGRDTLVLYYKKHPYNP